MATIRITDLKLRTIIGINDWERDKEQDIIINVTALFDEKKAARSDNIKDTVDYKKMKKRIFERAEKSKFYLLEKLCSVLLDTVLEDKLVKEATIRIDKPLALRFAKSVSIEMTRKRKK